jgi:protein translocase SecG subunit
MIGSILVGLFMICNIFLILIITMQKNHGGFWSGPSGTESSMLFGGNQGIDILQKLTWLFGIIFLVGCFTLSLVESSASRVSRFYEVQNEVKNPETNKNDVQTDEIIENAINTINEQDETLPKEENVAVETKDALDTKA